MNFSGGEIESNLELQWRATEDDEVEILGRNMERCYSSSASSSSSTEKSLEDSAGSEEPQRQQQQWKSVLSGWRKKSVRRLSTIPQMTTHEISRGWKKTLSRIRSVEGSFHCIDASVTRNSWRNYEYKELAAATDNFSPDRLIGKGGNAEVYRGCLADGQQVAVKRMLKEQKEEDERASDFLSELGIVAHANHPNAARLLGFSVDFGLHLVLQLAPHGSLASILHGTEKILPWTVRFKVAMGVAEGLQYLHHECQRRIIHRDIKASNILLTENYVPQISDFGLAKWLPEKWSHHTIFPIEGTFGYLSPEYFMHGIVNEKTDIFAYGVILLELITGRYAVDSRRQSLVMWAKPLLDANAVESLVDPRIIDDYDSDEMKRVMLAASLCIHHLPASRPEMTLVVQVLNGEQGAAAADLRSQCREEAEPLIVDCCDVAGYSSSTYLTELHRHKQLLME